MLNWVNRFSIFCFLDNLEYNFSPPAFECMLAADCKKRIEVGAVGAFGELKNFYHNEKGEWLFGHLGFGLNNVSAETGAVAIDGIGFSDLHFFIPGIVLQLYRTEVIIYCAQDALAVYEEILTYPDGITPTRPEGVTVNQRISKDEYIDIIKKLQKHILRGDCYEINFCQEFFAEGINIEPLALYNKLIAVSPNPFSAYYKVGDKYCICASPERYLKKRGNRISSEPIKGTSKRDLSNAVNDEASKQYLLQSEKERSENVMVVDLVRNDLSRVCVPGTVEVEELFGLYSFPQVHQMISTVSGEMKAGLDWVDCIEATFPMGSMTGAPKKRVLELIAQFEKTKRGLFSGAVGYADPSGDFDFNVVIRTMLYNKSAGYLSFQTGSGITFYSEAEEEYNECLLKAEAMLGILNLR